MEGGKRGGDRHEESKKRGDRRERRGSKDGVGGIATPPCVSMRVCISAGLAFSLI